MSTSTDLERQVIAHARILQSLIVYMSKSEPHFIEHFETCFVETMKMSQREHDYRDVEDYTEEFIRSIRAKIERDFSIDIKKKASLIKPHLLHGERSPENGGPSETKGIQISKNDGIWHVKMNGSFWGDFHTKAEALSALQKSGISVD